MSEDLKLFLLGILLVLALIGGGIVLATLVAGWLAVVGGTLLILAGVAVALVLVFAYFFGKQSMR